MRSDFLLEHSYAREVTVLRDAVCSTTVCMCHSVEIDHVLQFHLTLHSGQFEFLERYILK